METSGPNAWIWHWIVPLGYLKKKKLQLFIKFRFHCTQKDFIIKINVSFYMTLMGYVYTVGYSCTVRFIMSWRADDSSIWSLSLWKLKVSFAFQC